MNADKEIIWTEELSVGNSDIDKDHQKLIKIYNDLLELRNKGYNSHEFARILTEMTDYTMFHFKKEEAYMMSFSFPEFEYHRKKHVQLIYQVAMYNYELYNDGVDSDEVLKFLKDWWTNHIIVHDKAYEKFKTETRANAKYR